MTKLSMNVNFIPKAQLISDKRYRDEPKLIWKVQIAFCKYFMIKYQLLFFKFDRKSTLVKNALLSTIFLRSMNFHNGRHLWMFPYISTSWNFFIHILKRLLRSFLRLSYVADQVVNTCVKVNFVPKVQTGVQLLMHYCA